jgi:hypothetical protein
MEKRDNNQDETPLVGLKADVEEISFGVFSQTTPKSNPLRSFINGFICSIFTSPIVNVMPMQTPFNIPNKSTSR